MRDLLLQAIAQSLERFTRYPKLQKELTRLNSSAPLHILAIGKAAWQMADVAIQALTHRKLASCTVLTKYGFYPALSSNAAGCRFHRIRQVSCRKVQSDPPPGFDTSPCRKRRNAATKESDVVAYADETSATPGFDTSPCRKRRNAATKESDVVAYADETSAILAGDLCNPKCQILQAGHPIPDQNSIRHTKAILEHLQEIPEHEELIILLSGGTSALFELPIDGHSLKDIIGLNRLLLNSGLDIRQMNLKRQELSQVKCGKALSHVRCQIPAVYLLSDVEGNDPAIIGSGPFYGTGARRSAESGETPSVETPSVETPSWRFIKDSSGKMPLPPQDSTRPRVETQRSSVKESDVVAYADETSAILSEDVCNTIPHLIIGDNPAFLKVLRRSLQETCPLPARLSSRFINLETGAFAKALSVFQRKANPGLYLFGGELTLRTGGSGKGGRCAHLALLMAQAISGIPGTCFFAFATDGNDHIPESSGAIVDSDSWQQIIAQGIDPEAAISNYDSYPALNAINAIIPMRYTGTNVNEVYLLVIET